MTEAEQLDRLLQVIVQEEMRRLTQLCNTNLWKLYYYNYMMRFGNENQPKLSYTDDQPSSHASNL